MRFDCLTLGALLVATAACTMGCGTPSQRDCRTMLPRFEEAEAAIGIAGNVGPDARTVFANQAARSLAAQRWLESAVLVTEDMRRGVPALAHALRDHAKAAQREDFALSGFAMRARQGGHAQAGIPAAALRLLDGPMRAKYTDDAMVVNQRCGFLLTDPAADHPECLVLVNTLAHALAPAEEKSMSAHVAATLAELSGARSDDARVESALRELESALRELATAFLASVDDGLATTTIASFRAFIQGVAEARIAATAVTSEATHLRAMCK